jgi:hypothetical protein
VVLALPIAVAAEGPSAAQYRQAVEDAYQIVSSASPNDTFAAQSALSVLKAGTGNSQPEIINDLTTKPPDLGDARNRLAALREALQSPATTSDPELAQQRLRDVLSMQRYDALHRPPSLIDRLEQWLGDRFKDLLRLFFGTRGPAQSLPDIFFYALGAGVVAVVAVIVFRSARGRFTRGVVSGQPPGPRAPADFFAAADRLSASGDRVGAIRALCAGVAATLAGERTWEGSPLTVREIFQRAPNPERLRPLLLPFEAAVYGGRDVDPATYESAAAVAAIFRAPQVMAA